MRGIVARVLVVDDQPLFRAGLVALLNASPDLTVVGEAGDGDTASALAESSRPDVILLDIRLPGLAALTRVTTPARVLVLVLVLTTFDLDEHVHEALRLGAAGEMQFSPTVMRRLVAAYPRGDADASPWRSAGLDELTDREREVLRLVGTGLTNTAIAARLTVTEGTVKTHLNRVMTKLRLTSRAQAVVMAYESRLVVPQAARTA